MPRPMSLPHVSSGPRGGANPTTGLLAKNYILMSKHQFLEPCLAARSFFWSKIMENKDVDLVCSFSAMVGCSRVAGGQAVDKGQVQV